MLAKKLLTKEEDYMRATKFFIFDEMRNNEIAAAFLGVLICNFAAGCEGLVSPRNVEIKNPSACGKETAKVYNTHHR
jgi:hypothetical protein